MLLELFTNWIAARGGLRKIDRWDNTTCTYQKYLWRYYILKTSFCEIMIHRFFDGDIGPLHDHPWDSFNIILRTGYIEETLNGKFRRKPGYIGGRTAKGFHKVHLIPNTNGKVWTLFVTLKRKKTWGFLTKNGWLPFNEYFASVSDAPPPSVPTQFSNGLFPVAKRT